MSHPEWLRALAWASLVVGAVCAVVVAVDLLAGHRQKMWIMNIVWPVVMLWAGPLGLAAYFTMGRLGQARLARRAAERGEEPPSKAKPFWQMVSIGALHCGSGCTLGDLVSEWLVFWAGWEIAGRSIWAAWIVDYVAAFGLGIAFQYFSITPMRHLSPGRGLVQALKADTLSLTAWQVGMYGWMAVAVFGVFGREIPKTDPVFWFMMQIAMFAGFLTSYPVNWWLLRAGIKEKM
jgi:hypothetical protein